MSRTIINTLGTSLLGNAAREGIAPHDTAALLAYLERDPQKACAESNALSRLLEPEDQVVLLHSDTDDGRHCSSVLGQFYQQQGYSFSQHCIKGLSYHERGFVSYGLRSLVHLLTQEIQGARRLSRNVLINATGGFKAEIAYATAVGLVFGVPVCYIHEKFGDIVTLPSTPIGWDYSLFDWNEEFFGWLDGEPRATPEVQARLKGTSDPAKLESLLEPSEDGHTYLSALGYAYLEAFKQRPILDHLPSVYLSREALKEWNGFDPETRRKYHHLLERVRQTNRYAQAEQKSGGGDALGFPKGHINERLFFIERDSKLFIFRFTQHGREYDELCTRGLSWLDYPRETFTLLEL